MNDLLPHYYETVSFNRFWDYCNTLEDIIWEVTLLNKNNFRSMKAL